MRRPGDWIRVVASRVFGPHTLSRLIDPAVADMQSEWESAIRHGAQWRARWVQFSGYVGLLKAVAWYAVTDGVRHATTEDRQAIGRALIIAAASAGAVAVVLATWPLTTVWRQTQSPLLVLSLVPQVVPVALPVGLTIGVLFGLPTGSVSSRMVAAVCVVAGACTLTSFAITGWVIPIANESFRAELRTPPRAKAVQEMTSVELWRAIQARHSTGRDSRTLERALHVRLAITTAVFVLGTFAVAFVAWRRWSRPLLLVTAIGAVGGYWFLMERGDALSRAAVLSPLFGAWAANAVLSALCVLTIVKGQRSRVHRVTLASRGESE